MLVAKVEHLHLPEGCTCPYHANKTFVRKIVTHESLSLSHLLKWLTEMNGQLPCWRYALLSYEAKP